MTLLSNGEDHIHLYNLQYSVLVLLSRTHQAVFGEWKLWRSIKKP